MRCTDSSMSSTQHQGTGPELFFGIVGALGADLPQLSRTLRETLKDFDYASTEIVLSDHLRELNAFSDTPISPLDDRIEALQKAGNTLREKTGRGDAMAVLGMAAIREERRAIAGNAEVSVPRHAFVIRSLKHPAEVELLRKIYGPSFFLIAAYSPIGRRRENLTRDIANSHQSAREERYLARAAHLIHHDDAEPGPFGQHTRDAFPRADVFVDTSTPDQQARSLRRFCEILFGHPFHTPSRDEHAMFLAQATALRSSDPSRQVGAVIANREGDVIAVGTNEVPKAGGGLYWPDDDGDSRDFQLRESHSVSMRRTMIGEILGRLKDNGWLTPALLDESGKLEEMVSVVEPYLADTLIMDIGEFGRTVHAEMAALIDAARRGVSVRGMTLYTTTFPCHNCTKHIVAAGVARVVFVEPFPKSQATRLHGDSIVVDPGGLRGERVAFEPFVGVAPRRHMDLFTIGTRKAEGRTAPAAAGTTPRVPDPSPVDAYLFNEAKAWSDFYPQMDAAGLHREGES